MKRQTALESSQAELQETGENRIKKVMHSLSAVCPIPITYMDYNQNVIWEIKGETKLCNVFPCQQECSYSCSKTLSSAMKTAYQLGEAYLFMCDAGLVKIAYPVIINKQPCGCCFAGPIAMGANKKNAMKHLAKNLSIAKSYQAQVIIYLSSIKVYTPKEIQSLYDLFHYSILGALQPDNSFGGAYDNYTQNQPANASDNAEYPYLLETQLIEAIKAGNTPSAVEAFDLYFKEVCLLEAGNFVFVKIRLMELCGILSRVTGKNMPTTITWYNYLECIEQLNSVLVFQKLHDLVLNLVKTFSDSIASHIYSGKSTIVTKCLQYINENYKEDITLISMAKKVHTNPSYLSTLFKKEMQLPFTDYLTKLRLQKSFTLLSETNLSLTDISLMVGFNTQSYFAKVFKDHMAITPKEYRKSHQQSMCNVDSMTF